MPEDNELVEEDFSDDESIMELDPVTTDVVESIAADMEAIKDIKITVPEQEDITKEIDALKQFYARQMEDFKNTLPPDMRKNPEFVREWMNIAKDSMQTTIQIQMDHPDDDPLSMSLKEIKIKQSEVDMCIVVMNTMKRHFKTRNVNQFILAEQRKLPRLKAKITHLKRAHDALVKVEAAKVAAEARTLEQS